MSKLGVVHLLVFICIASVQVNSGFLNRIKNGHKDVVVVVDHQSPCTSRKCRPKPVQVEICQTQQCNACRTECYGNDECQNKCLIVDNCRNNCGGNYACINECGGQSVSVAPVYVEPYNRCQSCPPGCGIQADQPVLDSCVAGKSLFYVQIPSNVTLNSIVSNADLLELYSNSKLELNANGISGRACLNNTTRFDLTQLNATIQPITDVKK